MLVCAVSLSFLFEDLLKDRPLQAEGVILHNYVHTNTYLFITVIRKERSIFSSSLALKLALLKLKEEEGDIKLKL